VIQTNNYWHHF